jgi:hypothetical protein
VSTQRGLVRAAVWLAMTAVLAGSAVAYLNYRSGRGPADAARRYFAALARGDAPAALANAVPPAGGHALLTSAVLAEQLRLAPIRDVRVGVAAGRADRKTVPVHYLLAFPDQSQRVSARVDVRRTGGRWRVADPTATVTLAFAAARDRALVAGRRPSNRAITVFPGALPVRFDTPYLQLFVNSRAVAPGGHGRLAVSVQLTAAGRTAVLRGLVPMLRRCAAGRASAPTCPLPSSRYVPFTLRGRLIDDPARTLQLGIESGAPGTISIGGSIEFRGSFQLLSFDNIASRHTGELTIPVFARAFPVAPLRIRFEDVT